MDTMGDLNTLSASRPNPFVLSFKLSQTFHKRELEKSAASSIRIF